MEKREITRSRRHNCLQKLTLETGAQTRLDDSSKTGPIPAEEAFSMYWGCRADDPKGRTWSLAHTAELNTHFFTQQLLPGVLKASSAKKKLLFQHLFIQSLMRKKCSS